MERIATPSNARSRRTRAALLEAARAIIEDDGVGALTMSAVASQAGVTRRTTYLHFATRSDLMIALFEHVATTEDLAGAMAHVWAAPDAAAALDACADHLSRYLLRIVRVALVLRQDRRSDPDAAAHWAVVSREHRRDCRRLIQMLADEQRLATVWTVQSATDMLWALMSVDLLDGLVEERGWSIATYVEHLQVVLRSTFLDPDRDQVGSSRPER